MINWILARKKAIVAFVGLVATYLQVYNTTNPSHWITVVLGILTVLGVHQATNKAL